ncbi:MAG: anthranilate synthase component I family protein [Bacteroidia bacterium]|nr:anthranilate synthase component I family protein [Bacteroidia bacterium]
MLSFSEFISARSREHFAGIFPFRVKNDAPLLFMGVRSSLAGPGRRLQLPEQKGLWHFGYVSYEYKNQIEKLQTSAPDRFGWPEYEFFTPEFTERLRPDEATLPFRGKAPSIRCSHSKEDYFRCFHSLQKHIHRGDIYETNFCIRFEADTAEVDPAVLFSRIYALSEAPYSTFLKSGDRYVFSASPELYFEKKGTLLASEPMKGTRPRGKSKTSDEQLREELNSSAKERTENIMITDLVRNDLSRLAEKGTVNVPAACTIKSFKNVHQMISRVECRVNKEISLRTVLAATFPMGSMTGAPKIRAMELADAHEKGGRGLYSGTLGYLTPEGDMQFSVLIRTIFYDRTRQWLSFSVGSAITAASDPEEEYNECLIKAAGLFEALGADIRTFAL